MGTGWVTGAAGVGGVVAAAGAGAEAESDPGGGGGSVGESGDAGPEVEPGSGAGGGPVGGKGSPQGWSLVLYKEPSGQGLSGQRESCWGGRVDELASPAPGCEARAVCWPSPSV